MKKLIMDRSWINFAWHRQSKRDLEESRSLIVPNCALDRRDRNDAGVERVRNK